MNITSCILYAFQFVCVCVLSATAANVMILRSVAVANSVNFCRYVCVYFSKCIIQYIHVYIFGCV